MATPSRARDYEVRLLRGVLKGLQGVTTNAAVKTYEYIEDGKVRLSVFNALGLRSQR